MKQVRLIGADGEQLGVVATQDAFKQAKAAGLDVVLVADKAEPPVCRIMDFGKLVYEQKKKQKDQKKHQHTQKLKEIKFHVSIDPHDYSYKLKHAVDFLSEKDKLKVTIMFRGREMAHKEIGFEFSKKIAEDLKEHGELEEEPKLIGRNITLSFNPKASHR